LGFDDKQPQKRTGGFGWGSGVIFVVQFKIKSYFPPQIANGVRLHQTLAADAKREDAGQLEAKGANTQKTRRGGGGCNFEGRNYKHKDRGGVGEYQFLTPSRSVPVSNVWEPRLVSAGTRKLNWGRLPLVRRKLRGGDLGDASQKAEGGRGQYQLLII